MSEKVSESQLRALGLQQISNELKHKFPQLSRKERRAMARRSEKASWQQRDKAVIAKAVAGTLKPKEDFSCCFLNK